MTVLEVIQKSADFLARKGVDSPRLQAEMLLAYVLQLPRMKLYLNFERVLSEPEADALRELVKRRGAREPLQHILGTASFCGMEIAVNRHVLVPRPETELLAELGWEWLGKQRTANIEHSTPNSAEVEPERRSPTQLDAAGETQPAGLQTGAPTVLDFGTGSGCIAIALAVKCPAAVITASDLSPEALAVAKMNAERNGVSGRIEFVCGDGFGAVTVNARFDLIISNPPYIPSAEIETLQPEVRDFDPRGALNGGADGLDFYRRIAREATAFLKPGGKLMLEFGDGQAGALQEIFAAQMWIVEAVREDYSRRQRFLIARR